MDRRYVKDQGSYYLKNEYSKFEIGESVSVLFDSVLGTLVKHGSPENICTYFTKVRLHCPELAKDWVLIKSDRWKVTELNKMLDIIDYAGNILKDQTRFFE